MKKNTTYTFFSRNVFIFCLRFALITMFSNITAQGTEGYYRFPNIHKNIIVFSAEGDLWKVSKEGGLAIRITTHAEEEINPFISPDGRTIGFTARYDGPSEIYTIPIAGGIPQRWTYERDLSLMNGWTPDGNIIYDTRAYSTLPDRQVVEIDLRNGIKNRFPLSQASEASVDDSGETIFFVRPSFHGNVTKRYKGGTARQIWKYKKGDKEATKLTDDFAGGSHHPIYSNGRVYFISDRDGTMNIWSMLPDGSDKKQHTEHNKFDIRYASIFGDDMVYQNGADLWHYSISADTSNKIDIRISSDLDQMQEKWDDNPTRFITGYNLDKKGEKVVFTARGRVFVAPVKSGRFVEFTTKNNVRYRDANFSHDGKEVIALSDESGEFEFVSMSANGIENEKLISKDGEVLRYGGTASPDGKFLAYSDLLQNMFVLNLATGMSTKVSTNDEGIRMSSWSPDSKWLAFVQVAENTMAQIHIHNIESGSSFPLTTDRANSVSPDWSPDGKFIYFLSDRSFTTIVGSPWGSRQPDPYFDAKDKIYIVPLKAGERSPFRPTDELYDNNKKGDDDEDELVVEIDIEGIQSRIEEVPITAGNYRGLEANDKGLYFTTRSTGVNAQTDLAVVKIQNDDVKITTMTEKVRGFQLSGDKKKILIRKGSNFYVSNASTGKIGDINENKVDLSDWKFAITPKEDWKQIFTDAWRMERDYFYDANMHGVNWQAMHDKYLPLVDRVTTRVELSDLIGRFVGELSVLHTSVRGGDVREDESDISVGLLGGVFQKSVAKGGFEIMKIYKADPDYPNTKSPLDDPYLGINVGDVITSINGKPTIDAIDIGDLLLNQAGKQVLLGIKTGTKDRAVIVVPISNEYALRYDDWEYSKRMEVEEASVGKIGYVHLQAMGSNDLNQWYREFYPVFNRPGLIVDVRHNRGGNIESFVLDKLLRKAWMYWKGRSGKPTWNMQYAFRGHIVVLVDENTASDGEAFAEGFKRLGLGKTIGTRTWGGEVWLGSQNRLSDNGLARAPMTGVYSEEGDWLIEGHGFVPDIEVVNLPHETFNGKDAQLEAAIKHLEALIKEDPRSIPPVPAYPDKSFGDNKDKK